MMNDVHTYTALSLPPTLADPTQFAKDDLRVEMERPETLTSAYLLLPEIVAYFKTQKINVEKGEARCWACGEDEAEARQNERLYMALTCCGQWFHRHRHLPKAIKRAALTKSEELLAIKRRRENRRKHSKTPAKRKSEREQAVLG